MSAPIQQALHPPSAYLFTIRIHNNKPLLCYTATPKLHLQSSPSQQTLTHALNEKNTITRSPTLPTSLLSFTPQPLQSQIARNSNKNLKALITARPDLSVKQEEALSHSIILEESLISGLLALRGEETLLATVEQKMGIQQLLAQQTESVRLDSSLTEDQYSEIIPLTQQQRNFFTNFVRDSRRLSDSVFRNVNIPEEDCRKSQLQERRRVIRNFFKPKGSFFKDDRTCCNSYNNLDSLLDSRRMGSGGLSGGQL